MKTIKIFGYGSLINEISLRKTCPSSSNIFPAKLYGFIRVFNIKETRKLTRKNQGNISCLNIEKSEWNQHINGICFDMSVEELEALQEREQQFELVQVEVQNYNNEKNIHKAYVWRAKHFEAYDYQFDSIVQKEYLDMCLEGSKNFGDKFLKEFKQTTFIGDKTLEELRM